VTATEIVAKFRKPPTLVPEAVLTENHLRLRLGPEVTIAMGMMELAPGEGMAIQPIEMVASHSPRVDEMDAYERLLGAAMEGDAGLFAREDYVEEAWRIVDPVLKMSTPIYKYQKNTWGPREVEPVTPAGGWSNPTSHEESVTASGASA
jgi:glucose-6-phosphate 1-dehydrogenase